MGGAGTETQVFTYINDALDAAKNVSDRLANHGNLFENAGLADQDVEQCLVDADEL